MSLFAAQQRRPDALVLLGPAVGMYEVPAAQAADPAHTLVIHGEIDEVVPLANALSWAAPQDIPVVVLPQSSHFFHGKLIPLRDTLLRFVPGVLEK